MSMLLVLIPIALSAYTHLWNPAGFPNLFYDEGVYMRRAMHVMQGLGPQEAYYYDHPFFGQIFLAGMLTLFAVMPATWFTRMVLLDSLLLPLLLSSILLALYTTTRSTKKKTNNVLIL